MHNLEPEDVGVGVRRRLWVGLTLAVPEPKDSLAVADHERVGVRLQLWVCVQVGLREGETEGVGVTRRLKDPVKLNVREGLGVSESVPVGVPRRLPLTETPTVS